MKNDIFRLLLINVIENLGIMAAWTILAIFFNKWWITLFAILCFTSIKVGKNHEDEEDEEEQE